MANHEIMLYAKDLKKSFKNKTVVENFSISVKSGEIVGLLGPNGAGKTTSFYMIVGLIRPDSGEVYIDRENITHMPIAERAYQGLGYLPQEASVFRKMTVYDNVMAILEIQPNLTKAQRKEMCNELLEQLHITHVKDTKGMQLSGGERRRVEIARTLATQPKFILLDEPFAGVDPISVEDIKNIIRSLAQHNIGILITDHNVRETLSICDHATIMNKGSLLTSGSPEDILKDPNVRKLYLGEHFHL
jgi:lipopolysaccharide export system ATP-binding protein